MKIVKSKRSQITIFVIIGIVIVLFVVLFFALRERIIPTPSSANIQKDPQSFIDDCLKPRLKAVSEKLQEQGGYIHNPLNLSLDGKQISYLCYTDSYYIPCLNQEPLLIGHLKEEIHKSMENDVERCFNSLKAQLESENYQVTLAPGNFEVELAPRKIMLNIQKQMTIGKSESTQRFKEFKAVVSNPLYDLASVAQEISGQEGKYCNFETTGFGLLYPDFTVNRFRTGSLSTVYTINHKITNETFEFAVRGCAIPPGF